MTTDIEHVANEWADMATNGLQWLRNIKDGISTVDEALANMNECLKHCQEVRATTQLRASRQGPGWEVSDEQLEAMARAYDEALHPDTGELLWSLVDKHPDAPGTADFVGRRRDAIRLALSHLAPQAGA